MKKSVGGTDTVIEVGAGGGIAASFIAYEYTATANQTTFSGSDNNSNTLAYNTGTPPSVQVFMNGILLDEGSSQDYTGTNGTSVVLTTAADAGDLIQIHAYKSDVSIVNDLSFADNQKLKFGDSQDLEIYHDGSNSVIKDAGTGNLRILGSSWTIIEGATSGTWGIAHLDGAQTNLYHNGNIKLGTTSTGVDVTGEVQADSLDIDGLSVLTSNNNATPLTLERASPTSNQVGIQFSAGNSRYFGKGTDDEPYWATSANLTAGSKIVTAGNFTGILDSTYYQSGDNISVGTISSGAITSSGAIKTQYNRSDTWTDAPNWTEQSWDTLILHNANSTTSANQMSSIFMRADGGGNVSSRIILRNDNSGNGRLYFMMRSGSHTSTQQPKMLITDDGLVTISDNALTYNERLFVDGNLRVEGVYKSGTQTIIDASRNLTNIGTISAGVFTTNANTGTFSNSIGTFPLVTSTPYDYVAKFESTDSGAAIIIEDNNSTNNGNRVSVSGDTMSFFTAATSALTLDASQNATFAGTISSGAITSSGAIESTSLQTQNIYLSTALYTLNTAGNGWDSTINRNSGSPTANLPGGITSGNITTTGYLRGPSTFTIDPAAHGDDTGTVVIAGNLQIDGTTTTINSTTLTVDDKNITLASGSANAAAANGAGITVDGASATLTYVSTGDKWSLNKPLDVLFAGDDGVKIESSDNHSSLFIDSHTAYGQYIRFTENNANKYWINSASGKLLFRPAGTSTVTSQVVFDASGNVGIGSQNPTSHINTGTFFKPDSSGKFLTLNGGANGSFLMLESSTTTDNDQIGGIYWNRTGAQGDAHKQVAGIDVIQDAYAPNNVLEGGTLRFFTKPSGSGTNTPRMVIAGAGNVGIGTYNPAAKLHISGNSDISDEDCMLIIDDVDGSAGSRIPAIMFRSNTGGTVTNQGRIRGTDTQGMVLSGSSALSNDLVVQAGMIGVGAPSNNTFDSNITAYHAPTGSSIKSLLKLWVNTSDNSGNRGGAIEWVGSGDKTAVGSKIAATRVAAGGKMDMRFYTGRNTDSDHEKMRITDGGNVGIGTASPQENLEIHDATMSTISLSYEGSSGNGSSIDFNLRPSSAIASPLTSQIKATDDGAYRQNISFSTKTSAAASSGQTTRMMIKGDGNVGIGEDTPTHKLHVAGDIRIDNGSALKLYNAAGNGWAQIAYNNTLDHIEIQRSFQSGTDSYYNLGSSAKKWLSVYSDTIKAGNGTPAAPTYTFDSDQNTGMYIDSTADTLRFSTGGAQRMYLNSAGITSVANVYTGAANEFRNYGGTWKATTGTAAGDFEFRGNTGGTNTGLMYMDTSTGRVAVGNGFNSTNVKSEFQVYHAGIDTYAVNTSATSAAQVDTFPAGDFRSARFTVQITNTTDSTYQITEILLIHDGTTPSMTEYSTIFTGSAREASFDADIVSGNVRLLATPASADSMQFKVVRHSILV